MGVLYVLEDIRNPVLDFLFSLFTFLGSEAAVLVLGALGDATMWEAVFADVGVSVIAILNAMRTLKG